MTSAWLANSTRLVERLRSSAISSTSTLKPCERSFAAPELNCDLDVAGATPDRRVIRAACERAGLEAQYSEHEASSGATWCDALDQATGTGLLVLSDEAPSAAGESTRCFTHRSHGPSLVEASLIRFQPSRTGGRLNRSSAKRGSTSRLLSEQTRSRADPCSTTTRS